MGDCAELLERLRETLRQEAEQRANRDPIPPPILDRIRLVANGFDCGSPQIAALADLGDDLFQMDDRSLPVVQAAFDLHQHVFRSAPVRNEAATAFPERDELLRRIADLEAEVAALKEASPDDRRAVREILAEIKESAAGMRLSVGMEPLAEAMARRFDQLWDRLGGLGIVVGITVTAGVAGVTSAGLAVALGEGEAAAKLGMVAAGGIGVSVGVPALYATLKIKDAVTAVARAAAGFLRQIGGDLHERPRVKERIEPALQPVGPKIFRDRLADGSEGPQMVVIPAGQFWMGSPDGEGDEDEHPRHLVTITAPFALGCNPVTQAEWQAVMGNNPSRFIGADRPVECVSWDQAQDFIGRLSAATGQPYRLPSEAEWEYACRAGTDTAYSTGDTIIVTQARFGGGDRTVAVGSYPANGFGLHDMHGNVWEWVADRYVANYAEAPADGSVVTGKSTGYRVNRGGSWNCNSWLLRSANRDWDSADSRVDNIGLRLARSLP